MSPARRRRLLCSARRDDGRRAPWLLAPLCKAGDEAWARAGALLDRYLSPAAGQRLRNRLFPAVRPTLPLPDMVPPHCEHTLTTPSAPQGPGGYKNPQFQAVVDAVPRVQHAASAKVAVKANLLAWAVPALEKSGYYTYDGSLTTAPYSENVIWIVYKSIIPIGKAQVWHLASA